MPALRAKVTLKKSTNLPEDACTNTWHFTGEESDAPAITTKLQDFYRGWQTWITSNIAGTFPVSWYDLDDTPPRVPFLQTTLALSSSVPSAMPEEVALCMSFQALPLSGFHQSSRRNRVYLGPFAQAAMDTGLAGNRPKAQLRTDIATAGAALKTASDAASWSWVVRSEKSGVVALVHDGWVDDAFDTQRRRGVAPITRTVF